MSAATVRQTIGLGYQVVGCDALAMLGEVREEVKVVFLDELLTVS